MSEQAIAAAARAYVQALETLAAARKARRNVSNDQWREWRELVAYGQEKSIPFSLDQNIIAARAARKRTLTRLRRAVEACRPLPGQKVLFELPPVGR